MKANRILIAADKFKGSLSAREVAENIANGFHEVLADAKIDIVPMADGGEGTAEVICDALGGEWVYSRARDPLGREIEVRYAWIMDQQLAVMEMSEAAGMRRLKPNECDPDRANTFGVGEMILDATRRGAEQIIMGLGGSATNDGGFGMACALGYEFVVKGGVKLDGFKPSSLKELERVEVHKKLKLPTIIAAVDVRNPLLGSNGATRMFGPQKGVGPGEIGIFERALEQLADVVAKDLGVDHRKEAGAGAAGGLGFGLMSFCGAQVRSGFDVVAEFVRLETKMKDVDVVITGEGSLDRQTLEGKTPAGVAVLARKLGKPVYAIVGRAEDDPEVREIFDGVFAVGGKIPEARELLRATARQIAANLSGGASPVDAK